MCFLGRYCLGLKPVMVCLSVFGVFSNLIWICGSFVVSRMPLMIPSMSVW